MKHINRLECLRPFLVHFLLPFEKLGLLGVVIGPMYWLFTMPFLLIQAIFYCIPSIYLFCRLIFYQVPDCCKGLGTAYFNVCAVLKHKQIFREPLPLNEQSDEDLIHLASKYISPTINETIVLSPLSTNGDWSNQSLLEYPWYIRILVGLVASLFICTVLYMYADCFELSIKVMAITFIGIMVNIDSTGNYFMFAFFMTTYILQVFGDVKKKYQQLSTAVFELIKGKLTDDVEQIVALSASEQTNMAFKFFKPANIESIVKRRREFFQLNHALPAATNWDDERNKYNTSCTIKDGKLHWKIYHLVLFLDKNDVPHIPKALFRKFINLRLHGCPGPVYISLLNALKHLGLMTLFLIFVLVVVREFRDEVSSSNQLVLSLVGGFIPFILQMLLKPKSAKLDLSTYAFQGVINEIICEYFDEYPISDIGFVTDAESQEGQEGNHHFNKGK